MSIKSKIMNIVATHPKLVTLGIGLVITFAVMPHVPIIVHDAFAFINNGGNGN
jgi:hypothetical protein